MVYYCFTHIARWSTHDSVTLHIFPWSSQMTWKDCAAEKTRATGKNLRIFCQSECLTKEHVIVMFLARIAFHLPHVCKGTASSSKFQCCEATDHWNQVASAKAGFPTRENAVLIPIITLGSWSFFFKTIKSRPQRSTKWNARPSVCSSAWQILGDSNKVCPSSVSCSITRLK